MYSRDGRFEGAARAAVRGLGLALTATVLSVHAVAAQDPGQEPGVAMAGPGGEMVDRVAAVVGDSAILWSQVEQQILQMQAGGAQVPQDPAQLEEFRRNLLEDLVDQQLVLQAAARDTTIVLPEGRLQDAVEQTMNERIQAFGGESPFREALEQQGLSLTAFRSQLRDQIRRQMLFQQFFERQEQQRARGVAVTEEEMREFFEANRDQLEVRPATLSFLQAIVQPEPSEEARAAAREEAERILDELRAGEDFANLARQHSDDPGSGEQGGELGWYLQGDGLVEEFEDVAFALREGQISTVVETPFGAHIIKVERIRGAERKIHHILIAAEGEDRDSDRARERAEEIRSRVEAGESLRDLAREQGGAGIPDSLSVTMDDLDELPPGLASALRNAEEGELLGPVEFELQGQPAFSVVRVVEFREEGEYTFEDVRSQVQEILRSEKLEEQILQELRERFYVEIRL